jgi:lipoprotein signal peptidase
VIYEQGVITVSTVVAFLNFASPGGSAMGKLKRIDWIGSLLLFAAIVCFLVPLQLGGSIWNWNDPQTIALFVTSGILFIAFVYVEYKVAPEPIVPPIMFSNRSVPALLVAAICLGAVFFSAVYYISLFFQVNYGNTATEAGLNTIPLVFGVVLLSIGSGFTVSRTGKYVPFLYAGSIITTIGIVLVSLLSPSSYRVQQIFYLFILGVGIGNMIQMRLIGLQASVDVSQIAVATAVSQFCQTLGGALGVAFTGTIFNNVLSSTVAGKPEFMAAYNTVAATHPGIKPTDVLLLRKIFVTSSVFDAALQDLVQAFSTSFQLAYRWILPFSIMMLVMSLLVKPMVMRAPGGGGSGGAGDKSPSNSPPAPREGKEENA